MASPLSNIGTGGTIAFGTTSFTARFNNFNMDGIERPVIDAPHMAVAAPEADEIANMPRLLGEIASPGNMTCEIHFNPDTVVPVCAAAEQITMTWNGGATWVFSGGIVSYSASAAVDELMTGTVEIAALGPITVTAAA